MTPPSPLQALAERLRSLANLPDRLSDFLDEQLAAATASLATALPAFPAATLGSLAVGLPHAHPTHPPFLPQPPIGPLLVGCNPQVLINGLPAAVSGVIGISPTCGGLTPFFEVCTGSSKVFIGGQRAARMFDLTHHCRSSPAHSGDAAAAGRAAPPATGGYAQPALASGHHVRESLRQTATLSELAAGCEAASSASTAAERQRGATEAVASGLDLVSAPLQEAMGQLMGSDPALPVGGTSGAILLGSANVLIGGLPTPSQPDPGEALVRLVRRRHRQRPT